MLIAKLLELKNRLVKALRELRAATHARDSDHFKMPRIYIKDTMMRNFLKRKFINNSALCCISILKDKE